MPKAKTKIQQNTQEVQEKDLAEFTEEEISQFIDFRARKLSVLLAASSMPQEVKESWVILLPDMTLAQLDTLAEILEAEYLLNATAEIDDYFNQRFDAYVKEAEEQVRESEEKFLEKAESIENLTKELE